MGKADKVDKKERKKDYIDEECETIVRGVLDKYATLFGNNTQKKTKEDVQTAWATITKAVIA